MSKLTVLRKLDSGLIECECKCGGKIAIQERDIASKENCGFCHLRKAKPLKNEGKVFNSRKEEMWTYEYKAWRKKIYKRDKYKCVVCGSTHKLNAHHMNGWTWAVNERYDRDNGITLCAIHHDEYHNIYGKGKNNKAEFIYYLQGKGVDTPLWLKNSL